MDLTATEAKLMRFLRERSGQAVSREELGKKVWGFCPSVQTRTIDQTISKLRRKLRDGEKIDTVHRIGYRYVDG
jgi:DNA-binding response OmpR family regulator